MTGVGGNLGATGLASAALALEETLKGGDADALRSYLAAFEEKLFLLLEAIHTIEKRGEKSVGAPEESPPQALLLDREQITYLMQELLILREVNNLNALGVWEKQKPILAGINLEKLDAELSGLNFREVGKILRNIAATIGIEL